jgi:hypothetical protein
LLDAQGGVRQGAGRRPVPLADFDVSLVPGEPARILRVGDVPGEESGWTMHAISPAPDFVGAVVVGAPAIAARTAAWSHGIAQHVHAPAIVNTTLASADRV